MEKDPVCGKEINEPENILTVVFKNKTFIFCSDTCKIKFLMHPDKYIDKNNADVNDNNDD